MVSLTKALNPDDIERHITTALGDGVNLGRVHEAWHITRAADSLPALVLFRHTDITLDHIYRLCSLMLESGILRGYLVVTAPVGIEIRYAAEKIGIELLDCDDIEALLIQVLED